MKFETNEVAVQIYLTLPYNPGYFLCITLLHNLNQTNLQDSDYLKHVFASKVDNNVGPDDMDLHSFKTGHNRVKHAKGLNYAWPITLVKNVIEV